MSNDLIHARLAYLGKWVAESVIMEDFIGVSVLWGNKLRVSMFPYWFRGTSLNKTSPGAYCTYCPVFLFLTKIYLCVVNDDEPQTTIFLGELYRTQQKDANINLHQGPLDGETGKGRLFMRQFHVYARHKKVIVYICRLRIRRNCCCHCLLRKFCLERRRKLTNVMESFVWNS